MLKPNDLLQRSVELACKNVAEGGGPFGAVIADAEGRIVAEGCNGVTRCNDPTAHAEITAIRQACQNRGDFRLDGLLLYSSCEPCPMCMAAAWWARLDGVVYASTRQQAAAAGFDDDRLWQAFETATTSQEIPIVHLELPRAGKEFEHWLAALDRQPY
ncbi:MAG: nucleoside deaminase [Gammaproteobacteria bacterium]|nr:nucleoside deaminase [Gammaproteobacteria bacterium]